MKKTLRKKNILLLAFVTLFVAAAIAVGTAVTPVAYAALDDVPTEPTYGNYYTSDYDTYDEVIAANKELNAEIYGEGITMLKNEGNALPLAEGANISIFGKNSSEMLTGGSGSGAGGGGGVTTPQTALTAEGFNLNPRLISFYNSDAQSGSGRGSAPTNGTVSAGYNTGETPISMYTEDVEATYENYNDAAIVVISRIGGEGFDLPRTMRWNGSSYASWGADATQTVPGARSGDDHYLQLDQNEAALIKYVGDRFDKVIVLFNTGSQFETGFLDDPGHYGYHENTKAALWIGYPGGSGLTALAQVLKGEINPSGRTVDTWARDFKADPVWKNFANNMVEIDSDHKGNQYSNLPGSGGNGGGGYRNNYVLYKEGIYMGYRYYETRGFDEGLSTAYTVPEEDTLLGQTTTAEWESWYDAHVVYPIGHGLSYTTFTQEIVDTTPADASTLTADGEISVTVRVTNTGERPGKDVVQLYYTAPYTPEGIEKSHVVLAAFDKTGIIQPSEYEDVTVTFSVRDMASYDYSDANTNSFTGYELDAGSYEVRVMKNAHEDYDTVSYTVPEGGFTYATSETTGYAIENRFDQVSDYIDDYMTRADWEGTFPTTELRREAEDWVIRGLEDQYSNDGSVLDSPDKPWYTEDMPTTGASNGLTLTDMMGLEYDDPQWELFMDQLTVQQLKDLVLQGGYASGQSIPELDIQRKTNADGPAGWSVGAPSGTYTFWCNDVVLASTWNTDLAYEKGVAMGNEALWAGITGWYAPAVNIHRSPFSGRNFEYFSEDGYLSGMMSAYIIRGAQHKGLYCYVKHFGVNDQESNRCGLLTWLNEQSMREIYIRGFELCVKVGETRAMMSSLNRIGYEWAGGCYGLLTEILRNEWGFNGCVVTDSYAYDWGPADLMIRGGGNLALGSAGLSYDADGATATTVACLREMAHGLLYAHANSLAMNEASTPTAPKPLSSFTGATLRTAVVGSAYSASVANAKINDELYPEVPDTEIVYTAVTELPAGLSLAENGTITGTPQEASNSFGFTVRATYADYSLTAAFIISIVDANGSIVYSAENTELPVSTIGESYTATVAYAEIYQPDAAEDETFPPISYSLKDASMLPDGLTLSSDGTVSGIPEKECEDYSFVVVASAMGYSDVELEFTIDVFNAMSLEGTVLESGKFNESYVAQITVGEAAHEVTYSLKSGSTLPEGLTLTEGGYITGRPTEVVKDHKFTVVATSPFAVTQEAEFTITIGLAFNDFTLADGVAGTAYSGSVAQAQGAGSVKYTVESGTLPEGVTLSEDGMLSGTPTTAGVYKFTLRADADGEVGDTIELTLYIANAPETDGGCGSALGTGSVWLIVFVSAFCIGIAAYLIVKRVVDRSDE